MISVFNYNFLNSTPRGRKLRLFQVSILTQQRKLLETLPYRQREGMKAHLGRTHRSPLSGSFTQTGSFDGPVSCSGQSQQSTGSRRKGVIQVGKTSPTLSLSTRSAARITCTWHLVHYAANAQRPEGSEMGTKIARQRGSWLLVRLKVWEAWI